MVKCWTPNSEDEGSIPSLRANTSVYFFCVSSLVVKCWTPNSEDEGSIPSLRANPVTVIHYDKIIIGDHCICLKLSSPC